MVIADDSCDSILNMRLNQQEFPSRRIEIYTKLVNIVHEILLNVA
jgi:hypothetical protein